MHRRAGQNRGFTLVELLIVMSVIGILISMLLPAVNAAREAARRTQCLSQQRQYALALLGFESSHGALPVAGLTKPIPLAPHTYNQKAGPQLSWITLVLPYLEEQALYDHFIFDSETTAFFQPKAARLTPPSIGICPSGEARGRFFQVSDIQLSKANYVAYIGPQHVADQQYLRGALGGFPSHPIGQRIRRVKDGATRTLAVTEVRTLDHSRDHRGAWILSWGASSVICPDVHHEFGLPYDIYVPDTTLTEAGSINTHRPNSVNFDETATCFPAVARQSLAAGMPCTLMSQEVLINGAPRSFHPGGVVATALDGHAGFMANDVDASALGRLVSVHDGTPLNVAAHLR